MFKNHEVREWFSGLRQCRRWAMYPRIRLLLALSAALLDRPPGWCYFVPVFGKARGVATETRTCWAELAAPVSAPRADHEGEPACPVICCCQAESPRPPGV